MAYLDAQQVLKKVFDATNNALRVQMKLPEYTAAPSSPEKGDVVLADRATWDPLTKGSGGAYPVWYNGTAWVALDSQ
jgi:hypothetical protein